MPDINLLVHTVKRFECAGTRAEPKQAKKRLRLGILETAERAHRRQRLPTWSKDLQRTRDLPLVLLFGSAPRIVGRPHPARERAAKHERRSPIGMGRREQKR